MLLYRINWKKEREMDCGFVHGGTVRSYNKLRRGGMRICELKEKEVINVCSGRRLGCIADVEINICTGEIEAIVIPGPGKICGFFGTDCEYVIPFSCIKKIGPDIVLVEIKEEKFLQKF